MSKNGGLKISIPIRILQNSECELIDPILVDKSAFDKSIFLSNLNQIKKITKLINVVEIYFNFTINTC